MRAERPPARIFCLPSALGQDPSDTTFLPHFQGAPSDAFHSARRVIGAGPFDSLGRCRRSSPRPSLAGPRRLASPDRRTPTSSRVTCHSLVGILFRAARRCSHQLLGIFRCRVLAGPGGLRVLAPALSCSPATCRFRDSGCPCHSFGPPPGHSAAGRGWGAHRRSSSFVASYGFSWR